MRLAPWIGLAILVAAFGFRLIGISWGLPNELHRQSYHPDEPINWAASQQIDPAHLEFTPGFYNYGTLYLTLARLAGGYCPPPPTSGPDDVANYERCCLFAGRILSALAGAAAAWIGFLTLLRRTKLIGAALGGLALAFAPALVVHSRFFTVDVLGVCMVAASLFFALRLLPDKDGKAPSHYIRWCLLAGAFAGLAAGTKYADGVVLLALYAAVGVARRPDWLRLIVLGTFAALISFIISTPGVLLDQERFKRDFAYELVHTATGHGLVFVDTPSGYIAQLIGSSIGFATLTMLAGVAALGYAAIRKHPWALVLLAFAVPYYLLIGHSEVKFLRYTFPLYVPLALGFGWAMGQAHGRDRWGRWAVIAGIVAVGIQLKDSTQWTYYMAGPDPRDEAGRYFRTLAAKQPGMSVGVIEDPWFYTPALYKDSAMSRPQWLYPGPNGQPAGPQAMVETVNPKVLYFTPDSRPDYVTYSSLESYDLNRLLTATNLSSADQTLIEKWKSQLSTLESDYKEYALFGGPEEPRLYEQDLEYVHPYVYVWKRKDLP